jgi:enoyl-CoA hydratase
LINEVVADGNALNRAKAIALQLCGFPQTAMRNDCQSLIEQWSLNENGAMENEIRLGLATIASGETLAGSTRFSDGAGRHGRFDH